MWRFWLALPILGLGSCIAPSVLDASERTVSLEATDIDWAPATVDDVPGTYVSTELEGSLAAVLKKLVYAFGSDGHYTGAGLFDDDPPHFEVLSGTWELDGAAFRLDGGPAATLEVAPDGSLRLSGDEGRVVMRREVQR